MHRVDATAMTAASVAIAHRFAARSSIPENYLARTQPAEEQVKVLYIVFNAIRSR